MAEFILVSRRGCIMGTH